MDLPEEVSGRADSQFRQARRGSLPLQRGHEAAAGTFLVWGDEGMPACVPPEQQARGLRSWHAEIADCTQRTEPSG